MLEELTLAQKGERYAILTAMEKVLKEKKGDTRFSLEQALKQLNQETSADRIPLTVGGKKVGSVSIGEPRVVIDDPQKFGRWAAENKMGHIVLSVDLSEANMDQKALRSICGELRSYGAKVTKEYVAHPEAKDSLAIVDGRVICRTTGEFVPGAIAKPAIMHTSGCKPQEVSEAMLIEDGTMSIAGFIAGDV